MNDIYKKDCYENSNPNETDSLGKERQSLVYFKTTQNLNNFTTK